MLLGGLIAAAVVPGGVRRAGLVLTHDTGTALLAAAVLWLAAPLAAVAAMSTVVGLPIGLGLFVFVLPVLGFLGYLVCGVRLGELVLRRRSGDAPEQPLAAAALGLTLLPLAGMVPALGGVVTLAAMVLGSGAVVTATWRGGRAGAPSVLLRAAPAGAPRAPEMAGV